MLSFKMRAKNLTLLFASIILALLCTAAQLDLAAADDEQGPPEPGQDTFVGPSADPEGPPEPSVNSEFSSTADITTENSVTSPATTAWSSVDEPPEPAINPIFLSSTIRPHFNENSNQNTHSSPPEPSIRPHFTDSTNRNIHSSPPEPSTRPHFSDNPSRNIHSSPPEPSTRPHFTESTNRNIHSSLPEPSTRPHFTDDRSKNTHSFPPEPSTHPHFADDRNRNTHLSPLEPSTRPHFTHDRNQNTHSAPPEPSIRPHFTDDRSRNTNSFPQEPSTRPIFRSNSDIQRQSYYNTLQYQRSSRNRNRYQQSQFDASSRLLPQILDSPPEPGNPIFTPYEVNNDQQTPDRTTPIPRYGYPFTEAVWRCDHPTNLCMLKNRTNFQPLKKTYFQGNVALVLNTRDAAQRRWSIRGRPNPVIAYNGARLVSLDYFPARYSDACIEFSYFMDGIGKKFLYVLQRDRDDTCIYSAVHEPETSSTAAGGWQDVQLQLDLSNGDAKFMIELQFDIGESNQSDTQIYDRRIGDRYPPTPRIADLGYFAIRNFTIGYGTCRYNRAEQCDLPF